LDTATGAVVGQVRPYEKDGNLRGLTQTREGGHLLLQSGNEGLVRVWFGIPPEPVWKRALKSIGINPDRFLHDFHDETVVYDLENNRAGLHLHGYNVAEALLSDDGRTLVTTHDEDGARVLRGWDTHGRKPLRYVVGAPLGV